MTETTEEKEKAQQMAERYHSTDFKDLKIKSLEAQVTSLTKERDKLKNKIDPNEYYCTACRDCNWEGSSKFLRVSQFDECDITCPCCHSKNLVDTNIELNDNQSISNLHEYIDMQEFRISSIKSTSRVIANHNAHLKSQLSNRDKEIKELKENTKSIVHLFNEPDYFYDPNDTDSNECIRVEDFDEKLKDYDEGEVLKLIPVHELLPRYFIVGDHDQYFKTENEALASLQSKEGEEE